MADRGKRSYVVALGSVPQQSVTKARKRNSTSFAKLSSRGKFSVTDEEAPPAAFQKLPIEVNRMIPLFLNDRDICQFRLICRTTNAAINGDELSFWRLRFRDIFAYNERLSNEQLKEKYQTRQKVLLRGTSVNFHHGYSSDEQTVLKILRNLIVESFQGPYQEYDDTFHPVCINQEHLIRFILNSRLFFNTRRLPSPSRAPGINPTLVAIQLMCAHFLFSLDGFKQNILSFDLSQQLVYATSITAPIFTGPHKVEVNLVWVLHCLNFFRSYMVGDQVMGKVIATMVDGERPSGWRGRLTDGAAPLSRHWKGTYAFLDEKELAAIRQMGEEDDCLFVSDRNVDDGCVQNLNLEFAKDGEEFAWPKLFEERLCSRGHGAAYTRPHTHTRAQHRFLKPLELDPVGIHFVGEGDDDEHFYANGWLNPLPAQPRGCEIPGWQRITFMKYFVDEQGAMEMDALWAYEGAVLPGGRIVLGRWWWASEEIGEMGEENSGPFILWAVDGEQIEDGE
ncbi:hypothetical protein CC78DRAFT_384489 [Lojkania enalia]|uniref:F-box domain-containing protein n=1 Tax=Lojkania enalia TaxID=147567 RepID=A0A9P4K7C7_9PLEO|nr:hypothetical protein CC78DRAFT_384489 [Didymosphaeria enalia]